MGMGATVGILAGVLIFCGKRPSPERRGLERCGRRGGLTPLHVPSAGVVFFMVTRRIKKKNTEAARDGENKVMMS